MAALLTPLIRPASSALSLALGALLLHDVDDGLDVGDRPDGDVGGVQEGAQHRLFGGFGGLRRPPAALAARHPCLQRPRSLSRPWALRPWAPRSISDGGDAFVFALDDLGLVLLHLGQERGLVVLEVDDAEAGGRGPAPERLPVMPSATIGDVLARVEPGLLDEILQALGVLGVGQGLGDELDVHGPVDVDEHALRRRFWA